MRIGIDAKWFFHGNPSGRVVVQNLVKHLIQGFPENEYYIFLDRRDKQLVFPYAGFNVHLVYLWAGVNLLSNVFVLPFKASGCKLDVCLLQYFTPPFSNFKSITYVHDVIFLSHPEYFTLKERIYLHSIKLLSRFAHRICTGSNNEKKRLAAYRIHNPGKISVIYNGVDNRFRPREMQDSALLRETVVKYGLPDRFLLYVGRLNERKNIANLLESLVHVENKSIPLVLAGSYDWKMFDVEAMIDGLGIRDRVVLTGFVEDQFLHALYALATVFCFVSRDEGFGLPPLEAMASGVPVVVSNCACIPEICGEAGNYVDPDLPGEIAAQIDNLLENEALYSRKREMGLKRSRDFQWDMSAEKILGVVTEVLSEGTLPSSR